MSHQVDFIHVICTDPRIQKLYHEWLVKNDLMGKYDTIQFENPILSFLNPTTQQAMLDRIGAYIKLHGPHTVVLIDHFDCGAYKLSGYSFSGFKEEVRQHKANNDIVKNLIKKNYPELTIEIRYIVINHTGCVWLEDITPYL